MIFRAMELTGAQDVRRVAVLGDTVNDLEAGANAGVAMNIGVLSGAHSKEKLETAPHTHLIESVRKFPPLLTGVRMTVAAPKPADEAPAPPPLPPPPSPTPKPSDPPGPGFKSGSKFEG